MPTIRLKGMLMAMLVTIVGLATLSVPGVLASGKGRVQTVHGEVVAVTPDASPPVIVVQTQTLKKEAFIVGASVEPGTHITRGTHPVSLDTIRAGESVTVTGVKTADGLVARTIHVR